MSRGLELLTVLIATHIFNTKLVCAAECFECMGRGCADPFTSYDRIYTYDRFTLTGCAACGKITDVLRNVIIRKCFWVQGECVEGTSESHATGNHTRVETRCCKTDLCNSTEFDRTNFVLLSFLLLITVLFIY
ncbi:unnamed protein product [Calicophoron daubneyi]|uniref:UPAR/Ly6 domain-containing protein n=1 Tax=Calicophoron daubneyi TaxID=300641 RepID=A0AAV2T0X8_CALDB